MKFNVTIPVAFAALIITTTTATPLKGNPLLAIAKANAKRDTQRTYFQACNYCPSPGQCVTLDYHTIDDANDKNLCHGQYCDPDGWTAGTQFKYLSYGTKCRMTVTKTWSDAKAGDEIGHGDCPGVKGIKAIKTPDTDHSDFCWSLLPFSIVCRDRAVLEWDGCLSCGDRPTWCDASSECSSGCCDKNSHICSTPENSDCA